MAKAPRQKHNYTSELELKSLLIRAKNRKQNREFNTKYNSVINKYIKTYVKINNTKYPKMSDNIKRKKIIKDKLKSKIIKLSEITNIDFASREQFGTIILLMIKSILTKPNFSGYTYKTDFYSDAIHKILRYLHNFDHTLISKRTGIYVNAFAYISQIIHNSIVYIINSKKKEQENINKQVSNEILDHNLAIIDHRKMNHSTLDAGFEFKKETAIEHKLGLDDNIFPSIMEILEDATDKVVIYYPSVVKLTMDNYNDIKPYLKKHSVISYK